MFKVNSSRAKAILSAPPHRVDNGAPGLREFNSGSLRFRARLEQEAGVVKKLSFAGDLPDGAILVIESMASLMTGRPLASLGKLSIRECEAFLRDRNSELAFENLDPGLEADLLSFFSWLRSSPSVTATAAYSFPVARGPFEQLKLVDKVKELKAFLNTPEILALYQGFSPPELVDVEELTVFLQAPYQSSEERALFAKLHQLGVEVFREERLNFIPDA
jgi:hypothetical protein